MENEIKTYTLTKKEYKILELCLSQDELLSPIVEKLNLSEVIPALASMSVTKLQDGSEEETAKVFKTIGGFVQTAFKDSGLRDFLSIILVPADADEFDAEHVDEIKKAAGSMPNSKVGEVLVDFFDINRVSLLSFLSSTTGAVEKMRAEIEATRENIPEKTTD